MRLTTKGRFAVTAMVDLAMVAKRGPVSLATISERQSISLSYLEQLFGKLRRKNLVESVRGPTGGYSLARPGNKISIAEIVLAVDEPLDATGCRGLHNCHDGQQCIPHDLWMGLNEKILDYLEGVTLQQLVDGHHKNKTNLSPITMTKKLKLLNVAA
jgi:Rrf2 family transcriptional regulator, iron-sulfur cluster assembly transcription factor